MSYKANVDIVIALNALRITSFRKQGRLRFRLSLLRAKQQGKNVLAYLLRTARQNHTTALPTISTNRSHSSTQQQRTSALT